MQAESEEGQGMKFYGLLMVIAAAWCTEAPAQPAGATRPFTGAYVGPEIGAHEHHFFVNVTDLRTARVEGRYHRAWGVGGGAFAGYDVALTQRVRVGLEAGIGLG